MLNKKNIFKVKTLHFKAKKGIKRDIENKLKKFNKTSVVK